MLGNSEIRDDIVALGQYVAGRSDLGQRVGFGSATTFPSLVGAEIVRIGLAAPLFDQRVADGLSAPLNSSVP
ncbi:hypothetical protein [Mycolicibacterium fortuitum]|uniref:hypothetical protein n=1 Tax=Mycolicibacterium fortuitum TaxID=1766 RepID=UPI001054219C|nr:hypothetical protein [Mycolicibacterium fortuitum]